MEKPKLTALVVDDTECMLFVNSENLTIAGFEVIEARDGDEAIKILEDETREKIIFVLTDFKMKRVNGDKVAQKAKEKEIPYVVICSSVPKIVPKIEGVKIIEKGNPQELDKVLSEILSENKSE
jgi:CheY-like chemotaxis protein